MGSSESQTNLLMDWNAGQDYAEVVVDILRDTQSVMSFRVVS